MSVKILWLKYLLLSYLFSFILSITLVFALEKEVYVLQNRLKKTSSFSSDFIQRFIGIDGVLIQESYGKLWIKRPDLFHFHFTYPEDFSLISNGKIIWFYDPIINQVIINHFESIDNLLFILLINDQIDHWDKYDVKQNNDSFNLIPRFYHEYLKNFSILIDSDGLIQNFLIFRQDRQRVEYEFKNIQKKLIDDSKFSFVVPNEADIDDQR
ncbi:outer membrane lipoprotein chaperone LolA [Blochmannia endosymbiont of Colobopsis nipponica]|uniref:outer membrane lipoprotein chaperone LolA n=1 Tax=Blochmannia endosymbiont of Colobopsis nipponica TaxID=2681987 RepID=UPI001784DBA7|nr:outer membrane lipoprotein chaperone LolA [Blochmannia endosymbiont of Colobopsis nipponica]QOI11064.1 outer membrane lipoprotein chaperone LolA [Blochmannia endosymbiont of Colobopsis nipponica]